MHNECEDWRRERGWRELEGLGTGLKLDPDAEGRGLVRLGVEEYLVPPALGGQGRMEGQEVPTVRFHDLEPELVLGGRELILHSLLLTLHLSFWEGRTQTGRLTSKNLTAKISWCILETLPPNFCILPFIVIVSTLDSNFTSYK